MSATPAVAPLVPASGTVEADLTFIIPQATKPYFESSALTGAVPRIFFHTEARRVSIRDARPLASRLALDVHGFTLHRHETAIERFVDNDAVNADYDAELEGLLKALTGADRVAVFDRTRRSDAPQGATNRDGLRGPAGRVHVDYTVASGPKRAADVLGGAEEIERVVSGGGRIMQVNVWRPMSGPVRRTPLALADASSVAPCELIATDQVFPDRVGEIYSVAYGPGQRWYWVPEMNRDEVLLIKGWDSVGDGRARFTPHGAFTLPGQRDDAPPRESIEVRTFLVFEP